MSRNFDFSQAASKGVTVLPDLTLGVPSVGDVASVKSVSSGQVFLGFSTPATGVAYLPLSGGTLSGPLILAGDPTNTNQASTKHYVDTNIATVTTLANNAQNTANNAVLRTGDTMTGVLTLAVDPSTAMQAATKGYVDSKVSAATAGVASFNTRVGAVVLSNADVVGVLPASTTLPLAAGAASAGAANAWARGDHVHPALPAIAVATTPAPSLSGVPNGELWWDTAGMQLYIAYGGAWVVAINQSGYVIDAPSDGHYYARHNASWAQVAFSDVTGAVTYAQLPTEVAQVPISVPFVGKPTASMIVNIPMTMALTIPGLLAGTRIFATTGPSGAPSFIVNKISGGSTTPIGTIQVTGPTSCTLSGSGGSLAATDTLQIVCPSSQDSALSDLGITLLASRV